MKEDSKTLNNVIVHESIQNQSDSDYIASIMHSKSLSSNLRISKNIKNTDDKYSKSDIDALLLDRSEVVIQKDGIDSENKASRERRISDKLKPINESRKYYSNNNSIIELQQVDDKRYVTCKTRVIPNSE